jgi:hypothetical protein
MQRPYPAQAQQTSQPQMQPQVQMPTVPQMNYDIPIQDVRFVTSEEAKAYIVMPNAKALLIDRNSGVAHLKTADSMGQSKTEYFRFEPINADGTPIKPQEPTPQIDFGDFVKREQLKDFGFVTIDEHRKVLAELDVIKKMIMPKTAAKGGQ